MDITGSQDQAQTRRREEAARARLRQRERVAFSIFLVLALVVALNFRRVEVSGHSMEPAFHSGDMLLVWKTAPRARLQPGDVIVFRGPDGDELIKRIFYVGSPGMTSLPPLGFPRTVSTPSGAYLRPDAPPEWTFQGYFDAVQSGRVPAPAPGNTIYVLGDNLGNSKDSRDFGPIDPKVILGKVVQWGKG